MANQERCKICHGTGHLSVLTSPHDDKREDIKCPNCRGRGVIYTMSDDDERDYHADYW